MCVLLTEKHFYISLIVGFIIYSRSLIKREKKDTYMKYTYI